MKKIHDINLTLSNDIPIWPDDIKPDFKRSSNDIANVTCMNMSVHTGTHVDAPCHFLNAGTSVDNLPLDILIGKAQVIEFKDIKTITAAVLKSANIAKNTERLLIQMSG